MFLTYLLYWIAVGIAVFSFFLYVEYKTEGEVSIKIYELLIVLVMILLWPLVILGMIGSLIEKYNDVKIIEFKKKENK